MTIDREIIKKLMDQEGHILFIPFLGAVYKIKKEEKKDFIKEIIRLDSSAFSEDIIEREAEDIFQISEGNKPLPQYCTGFRK